MPPSNPPEILTGAAFEETATGLRWKGVLAADHLIFAGHFAGEPILPAVVQLELVRAAAAKSLGEPCWLRSIEHSRFRQVLRPGDAVEVQVEVIREKGVTADVSHGQEVGLRFSVRSGERLVMSGGGLLGREEGGSPAGVGGAAEPSPAAGGEKTPDRYPAPGGLLPHSYPALLVQRIEEVSSEAIACSGAIPAGYGLVAAGTAPSFLGLEAGAQAAGLFEALQRGGAGGGARAGYVVGLRDTRMAVARLPAETPFQIVARRSGGAESLAVFDVELLAGGRTLVRGTISVFLPPAHRA
jgi:3-hydroxyacyl-[acyl-carrier-protein] dehydratase